MITFMLTSLFGVMLIGIPILISIALIGFVGMAMLPGVVMPLFAQKMFGQLDSFTLLAMPYFILAGSIMTAGGISKQLVDFARALVGHFRAGLAHASVVGSMMMSGVSGSSTADASAIASILIPPMKQSGYKPGFAAALIATAGTMGAIIPPSMTMVIYGAIAQVSIGGLFLGGIIPGIMIGLALMITIKLYTYHPAYPELRQATDRFDLCVLWRSVSSAWSGLLAPLIIVGGILSGVFTATEAGAVACVYALVIGFFVEKKITLAQIPRHPRRRGDHHVDGVRHHRRFRPDGLDTVVSAVRRHGAELCLDAVVESDHDPIHTRGRDDRARNVRRLADRAAGLRASGGQRHQFLRARSLSSRSRDGHLQPDRSGFSADRAASVHHDQHRQNADRPDQPACLDLHAGGNAGAGICHPGSGAFVLDSELLP